MRREPVRADLGAAVLEPGDDHEPADRTLQPAEDEQSGEPPAIPSRNRTPQREPADADEEDEAEQPPEQPMDPFPQEDELEPGEAHASRPGDLTILRGLPVEVEGMLPVGRAQGRYGAADRPPFGNRQAAFGQAG